MQLLPHSAALLGALLREGDWRTIARQARARLSGSRSPLPDSLAPHPRPAGVRAPNAPSKSVLAIRPSFRRDGAPISQFELAAGLQERGWNIVAAAPEGGPLGERYEAAGIEAIVSGELSASPVLYSAYEKQVGQIANFLKASSASLVFASTVDCYPIVDAARIAGVRTVWNIRESEPWRLRLADRNPKIAARALAAFDYPEALIFVAQASQAQWRAFAPATKQSVIYNAHFPIKDAAIGERSELRTRLGWGEDEIILLSVGTVCERKGQTDLVDAMKSLPPDLIKRTRAIFIGSVEAPYRDRILRNVSDVTRAHCNFVGPVDNPLEYIAAADMLINTSRSEAFPRVFIEAAKYKTPIIATPVDGAGERLREGVSARFYEPAAVSRLVDLISELCNDPHQKRRLAAAAHEALITQWTYDDMVNAYDKLLAKAAGIENAV